MTSQKQKHQFSHHLPVLLEETVARLSPSEGESFLDLTAGYGGHATKIISLTKAPAKAILVDRDPFAIEKLRELFADRDESPHLMHSSCAEAATQLWQEGKRFDMILMDLGISSPQIDIAQRGFSFMQDGPLDMRMSSSGQTAAEVVNNYEEQELITILKKYGEEPRARAITAAIIENRPFSTTTQLAELIEKTIGRRGKTHPATRTFQALRIEVNQEIAQLEATLPLILQLLNVGGRAAFISFHSLEDRIIKRFLKEESSAGYEATLSLPHRKPILGTLDVHNPRARSAKLRSAVKITHTKN